MTHIKIAYYKKRKELKIMKKNNNYNPSERQKKCMYAFLYYGKNMDCTYCRKNISKDDDLKKVSNEECESCESYSSRYIEYPISVNKIQMASLKPDEYDMRRAGMLVKVRPCKEEYHNKTYLGLYLGELPYTNSASYDEETGELKVKPIHNPAIYIFDLKRIIFGAESWWQKVDSIEDVSDITDADIDNVWYVKLLNQLKDSEM